jgi:acyl-CoA thioesterase YciA
MATKTKINMQYIATNICRTSEIGINGNLFGGTMLSWLDTAGASLACHLCSTPDMITLKMSEVLFRRPVKTGDHIRLYGRAVRVGTSSITLALEARRFLFANQEEEVVCSTEMTFVRIDEQGRPVAIIPSITINPV